MSKRQKSLQPQYMQNFNCICADCEDTCCSGWQVFIDKATCERYKKCPDLKFVKK